MRKLATGSLPRLPAQLPISVERRFVEQRIAGALLPGKQRVAEPGENLLMLVAVGEIHKLDGVLLQVVEFPFRRIEIAAKCLARRGVGIFRVGCEFTRGISVHPSRRLCFTGETIVDEFVTLVPDRPSREKLSGSMKMEFAGEIVTPVFGWGIGRDHRAKRSAV